MKIFLSCSPAIWILRLESSLVKQSCQLLFSDVPDLPGEGRKVQRGQQEAAEARGDADAVVGEDLHPSVPHGRRQVDVHDDAQTRTDRLLGKITWFWLDAQVTRIVSALNKVGLIPAANPGVQPGPDIVSKHAILEKPVPIWTLNLSDIGPG